MDENTRSAETVKEVMPFSARSADFSRGQETNSREATTDKSEVPEDFIVWSSGNNKSAYHKHQSHNFVKTTLWTRSADILRSTVRDSGDNWNGCR